MSSWTNHNGQRMWTVAVGGLSRDELLLALRAARVDLNAYAALLFTRQTLCTPLPVGDTRLVARTVSDLGFPNGATHDAIGKALPALGLGTCTIAVAAYLRLAYVDQPVGEQLTVFSDPPFDAPDYPSGLYLRRDAHSTWLRGYRASSDWTFPAEHLFALHDLS